MHGFAGILFQVRPGYTDFSNCSVILYLYSSVTDDGQFVLADLVALRQIGVKIIFSRKHGPLRNACIDGEAEFDRHTNHFLVGDRQYAWQAQVNGARQGIGSRAEAVGRAREYLAPRSQLHV